MPTRPIRKIAVLIHHRHANAEEHPYRIWHLVHVWRERGLQVEVVSGIGRRIQADLIVPQIDLSVIPDDYWAFLQDHRWVVNRRVRDIRKSTFSRNLVRPGDGYEGPVIVKTDLNLGGVPELRLLGSSLSDRLRGKTGPKRDPLAAPLRRTRVLHPERYPIFNSVREVPPEVFDNPDLIVERLLEQKHEGEYVLNTWTFFGGGGHTRFRTSTQRVIKAQSGRMHEAPPPPDEIRKVRERLGLEYGKLDWIMTDGAPSLIDVNRTPGVDNPRPEGKHAEPSRYFADGLTWFERDEWDAG